MQSPEIDKATATWFLRLAQVCNLAQVTIAEVCAIRQFLPSEQFEDVTIVALRGTCLFELLCSNSLILFAYVIPVCCNCRARDPLAEATWQELPGS